jgi:hypothetical protein
MSGLRTAMRSQAVIASACAGGDSVQGLTERASGSSPGAFSPATPYSRPRVAKLCNSKWGNLKDQALP